MFGIGFIVGPVLGGMLGDYGLRLPFYFLVREQWPGAIWLSVVAVYLVAVPLVLGLRFARAVEN
ncbi:hypothetical protein BC374_15570 [Ensifer sp. LC13]|nr:hypothetical protein BC362_07875 [Ensifer sp. LC14]OCP12247.1 hypothetical protein BC374_15570 [Ensifer sp. LC13]OCP13063.1 hypothetical protein BBX50_15350 [Ensifer sp. LC11]OCP33808.1 hypothetical protein BC364_14660 [Ensifer sp. LC499]